MSSSLRLVLLLLVGLSASTLAAPPKPANDIWIEGENCADHDFTTVGRDAAFGPCYESAILQLQTHVEAPEGGYHATFRPEIAEAGWYELLVAATRTESSQTNLSLYYLQVGDLRERRIEGLAVSDAYGPGDIFGWLSAGRFKLAAGEAPITFRCRDRRASDNAYLLYIDAIALRRIPEPTPKAHWIAGPQGDEQWTLEAALDLRQMPPLPILHVVCSGESEARIDGAAAGRSDGRMSWGAHVGQILKPGTNRISLKIKPQDDGGVLAWIESGALGAEQTPIIATGDQWCAVDEDGTQSPVRVLASSLDAPWGDMEMQPMPKTPVGKTPIPLKTGNLSVDLIMAVAKGQPRPEPRPHPEFDDYQRIGSIQTVEDYICWMPLEPERDKWQWEYYERNCEELEARGMRYAVYPWLHFPPKWAPDSELWEPMVSLKNGKTTWAPSIWSPRTLEIFDRFYAALREQFGDRVREVFVSMICDYGEVGYPIGMADWVVPAEYKGADFWCGDEYARADFREQMVGKYGDLDALNKAWGTDFAKAADVTYPEWTATEGPDFAALQALPVGERGQARRRWLDFAEWYLDAMVDFAGKAVAASRRYFPDAPHEIKIGFGSERVMFGADYTHYVARCAQDGYTVRSTHGKLPPYFYRRFSSAAKHYGAPLVTEPPSNVDRAEEVQRIFKDATSGTTEYFDYPNNVLAASDIFARFARYMEGEHSLTDVAFFFPTTDHRLRQDQSTPNTLLAACSASRDLFDWDILDERLVLDGALDAYRTLIMPEGNVIEAEVLQRLTDWVEAGGLLIAEDQGGIETVEGDTSFQESLFVRRDSLPSPEALVTVQGQPADSLMVDVGSENDEAALAGDWNNRESGHWEWGGDPGAITKRWSGAQSRVLLPVDPASSYELAAQVALHPKRFDARYDVRINGVKVGSIVPKRTSVFRATISPEVLGGRGVSELVFDVDAWKPSEVDGSTDQRTLGLAVDWVKLWRVGTQEPEGPAMPRISREANLAAIARACTKRVGQGATVLLPGGSAQVAGLVETASRLADDASALIPGRARGIGLDGDRDGVWTALMPGRILLYNSSDQPRTVALKLAAEALAAAGAQTPVKVEVTVEMLPVSVASVELPGCEVLTP